MSEVHRHISKQVEEKVKAIEWFKTLDEKREQIIMQLIESYRLNRQVELKELNGLTSEMNQLALKYQLPSRKIVTWEMFETYAKNESSN